MAEIELTGMDILLSKLEDMSVKVANQITKVALKAGGDVIAKAMEEESPVEEHTKGMSKSIEVSNIKTKAGVKYVEVAPDKDHFYYTWIELGKSNTASNPFMSRGFAKSKKEAMDKIKEELKLGLGL